MNPAYGQFMEVTPQDNWEDNREFKPRAVSGGFSSSGENGDEIFCSQCGGSPKHITECWQDPCKGVLICRDHHLQREHPGVLPGAWKAACNEKYRMGELAKQGWRLASNA